jgi:hypothetical protein
MSPKGGRFALATSSQPCFVACIFKLTVLIWLTDKTQSPYSSSRFLISYGSPIFKVVREKQCKGSSAKVTLCLSGAALPTSDVVEQIESGFDELIDSASEIAHGA